MQTFGIDISKWQEGIDLAQAKAEGARFVIVKCSESNYVDPQFENNYKRAKAAGLPVGAYHYTHARSVAEAKSDAAFVIKTLKGKQFEYPIFLDIEDSDNYLSVAENTEIVKAFCDTLEAAGYWAGFYTYLSRYQNHLDASLAKRYSFWLAAYFSAKPDVADVQMWQFGGNTNLIRSNQIAGYVCDQDYCYVDFPTLIKAKGLNGFTKSNPTPAPKPTPTPAPAKKSVDEIAKEVIAGKWGNGQDRKNRLTSAGYNYNVIQARVDQMLQPNSTPKPAPAPSTPTFKVGDHIKLKANAVVYGTNDKWDGWVYNATFFIREIDGSRIVFAPAMTGAVTGAVDSKYVTKI